MTWVEKHFSELYAESSRNGLYKSPEFHGSGCRIVNMTEMFGFEFIGNQEMQKVELDEREMQRDTLTKGDLLFGRRSIVPQGAGKCALVTDLEDHLTFESSIIRTRLKQTIAIPKFYYYWFNSPVGRREVDRIVSGTNIKGITGTDLQKIVVPNPPLEQQRRIVEILSDCDAAIESVSGLINQNKSKLQAISQRVFSSVYKGKESKLSDYLIEVNDKVVPSESTPLYSLTIEDGICEKTDRYERGYLVKDASSKTYKKVEFNDIVFNPQNVRWGAITRSKITHPVCLSPIYEVVRVREDVAVPEFFDFLLTNQRQVAYYASKTEGSLIERMSFKIDAFMLLRFDIPTKADQIKMVSPLEAVQNEIFLLQEQLALLIKQKRGLMQQLLPGKLREQGAA